MKGAIKVGLVGVRGYGARLYEMIQGVPGCSFYSCFHLDEKVARDAAGRMGCEKFYTNSESFFSDPDLDAVIIATPNPTHFEFVKQALQNKKHVWVEKPLTNTTDEGRELVDLARAVNKVLIVGHNHKKSAHVKEIKKQIELGKIGKIVAAEFNMSHGGGLKFGPDKWRFHKEKCPGGPLNMLGTHLIDTAIFLFGKQTFVSGIVQKLHAPTTAEDMSLIQLKHESGVVSNIVNLYNSVSTEFINIYGTSGAIRFSRWPNLELKIQGSDIGFSAGNFEHIELVEANPQKELFDEFVNKIVSGDHSLEETEISLEVVKIMNEILLKNKTI